jgi:hypothetical protein
VLDASHFSEIITRKILRGNTGNEALHYLVSPLPFTLYLLAPNILLSISISFSSPMLYSLMVEIHKYLVTYAFIAYQLLSEDQRPSVQALVLTPTSTEIKSECS